MMFTRGVSKGVYGSPMKFWKRLMHIEPIKMRWGTGDNYAYVLTDDNTKDSWIIDPAEVNEVMPVLEKMDINLKAIVNTHHHHDHSGGNRGMLQKYPGLPLIAGRDSPLVSYTPQDGEKLILGANIVIQALYTPCHTQDSICYYVTDNTTNEKLVLSGDTLFNAGCGRFFEGTGQEMDVALNKILASLPEDTLIYPGHEYTKSNVKFNLKVMPHNELLLSLQDFLKYNEITTGKFTIKDEKSYNPFMRVHDKDVLKFVGNVTDSGEIVSLLREAKNNM